MRILFPSHISRKTSIEKSVTFQGRMFHKYLINNLVHDIPQLLFSDDTAFCQQISFTHHSARSKREGKAIFIFPYFLR